MEGVVQRGTATLLKQIGKPLAGKTARPTTPRTRGSSASRRTLAVGVYLGFDKPRSLGDRATGGGLAAPIDLGLPNASLSGQAAEPRSSRVEPPASSQIRVSASPAS